jgi:hypothetical protein
MVHHLKQMFGGTVIALDILLGIATPAILKNLHHETRSHLYGAYAVYGVLAVCTLIVITSVVRNLGGGGEKQPAPASRPRYGSSIGGGRRL